MINRPQATPQAPAHPTRVLNQGYRQLALALIPLLTLLVFSKPALARSLAEQFSKSNQNSSKTIDHAPLSALLKAHIIRDSNGLNRVNYQSLKAKQTSLKAYIKMLQSVKVTSLSKAEQFAYWANLYNAVTLDVVLEAYPVKSIKDIDISPGIFSNGPWGKKLVTVEGTSLSLDDIEHKILRVIYQDPRVHYAVNCASIGCPNLQKTAFTGAKLNQQLEAAARDYVNSPRGIMIKGDRILVSKIYSWFKKDFGSSQAAIISHLKKYANSSLKAKLNNTTSINSYFYDWTLNDTGN